MENSLTHTSYPIYQVDAFSEQLFKGNPAAVIPLETFPSDSLMQSIAAENNLAETAFVVPRPDGSYNLRWFTPTAEIEFCGHATVASAHVLIHERGVVGPIVFHTQIGGLEVSHNEAGYTLAAPHYMPTPIEITPDIRAAFGRDIVGTYQAANNIYVEFTNARSVRNHTPQMSAITHMLETHTAQSEKGVIMGVSIMSAGDEDYDFISRHFAPLHGVDEDPVTGSAHAALGPFWAQRLGKAEMLASQCSARGGILHIQVQPDTVLITGQAITYLRGEITI